jgi:hypothetical protein
MMEGETALRGKSHEERKPRRSLLVQETHRDDQDGMKIAAHTI